MNHSTETRSATCDLSFVIPVYNGAATVGAVVERIVELHADLSIQIVLVDDGSDDDSRHVCARLAAEHGGRVVFVRLARNFGEHNAVLAGLHHTTGRAVAVLDDDGQNPPDEVRRMYDLLHERDHDVVYGRYAVKHHDGWRNLGSRFNDRIANVMLKKPPGLYLSSFKVMNRFLVDEITRYGGAFPYIDGLILRATRNIGQLAVQHRERADATSNYTLRRLARLWLNMFLNFSILPLRLAAIGGVVTAGVAGLLLVGIVIDKIWINPTITVGLPTVLVFIAFFAGVQLLILGTIGEYIGRLFLDHSRTPQFVVRSVDHGRGPSTEAGSDAAPPLRAAAAERRDG